MTRLRELLDAQRRDHRGATTAEYVGVVVLVAGLVGTLVVTPIGPAVAGILEAAFCRITPGGCSGDGGSGEGAQQTPLTSGQTGGPLARTGPEQAGRPATVGRRPGGALEEAALEDLPEPEATFPTAHAVGAAGSGSVMAMGALGAGAGHGVDPTGAQADPVNSLTGAFTTSAVDLAATGIGPALVFSRSYDSGRTAEGPLGPGWTHGLAVHLERTDAGMVLVDESGQRHGFSRRDGGWQGDPGVHSELTAAEGGFVVERPDGLTYRFDADGRLTRVIDGAGREVVLDRDEAGRLVAVTAGDGRRLELSHDDGRIVEVVGPAGRRVAFEYTDGLLTAATLPGGRTTSYTYEQDRLVEIVDASGRLVVANEYGEDGRVVTQTDAAGHTTRFTWHEDQQVATMFDATGSAWSDVYRSNVLVRRIDPYGNAVTYHYDAHLRVVAVEDELGRRVELTYNQDDRPVAVTARGGDEVLTQRLTWEDDELVKVVDAAGRTTTLSYDDAGRPVSATGPDGSTTRVEVDPATGLPTSVIDPSGRATRVEHDRRGRPVTVTDPAGDSVRADWDRAGNLTGLTDPTGRTLRWRYDDAGRPVAATGPAGATSRVEHDASGRVTEVVDARGDTTAYSYDGRGLLEAVRGPRGGVTAYRYDEAGRLVRRTTPRGDDYSYSYDAAGRLVSLTLPTGESRGYHWNAAGELVRVDTPIQSRGGPARIDYEHDPLGRLVGVEYSDGTPPVALTYADDGSLAQVTDALGTAELGYDEAGRLASLTRDGRTLAWEYDAAGRVVERRLPSGGTIRHDYEEDGDPAALATPGSRFAFDHDTAGRLTRVANPDGSVETRRYDPAGRLATQEVRTRDGQAVLSLSYHYDAAGNPLRITDRVRGTTTTYRYDDADQLVRECVGETCTSYAYDAAGNRVRREAPGGTTTWEYDATGRITDQRGPDGAVAYRWDRAGRLLQAGETTYRWNLAGQLTEVEGPEGRATHTYDGFRLRAATDGPRRTTTYTWDPVAVWPLPTQVETGDSSTTPVWGPSGLQGVVGEDGTTVAHTDHLGSVVATTGPDGDVLGRAGYSAFGTPQGKSGDLSVPFGFTGELTETGGRTYLRARSYDPRLGRFLSPDPAAADATDPFTSPYLYVQNRPTLFTDPLGLFCFTGTTPDGSCRGSGVTSAIGQGAAAFGGAAGRGASTVGRGIGRGAAAVGRFGVDAGKAAWRHRQGIGAVVVAGGCVTAAVSTAGAGAAVCTMGGHALFADAVATGFDRAGGLGAIRQGQFDLSGFATDVTIEATLEYGPLTIPTRALEEVAPIDRLGRTLAEYGFTTGQRVYVGTKFNLVPLVCTLSDCSGGALEMLSARTARAGHAK